MRQSPRVLRVALEVVNDRFKSQAYVFLCAPKWLYFECNNGDLLPFVDVLEGWIEVKLQNFCTTGCYVDVALLFLIARGHSRRGTLLWLWHSVDVSSVVRLLQVPCWACSECWKMTLSKPLVGHSYSLSMKDIWKNSCPLWNPPQNKKQLACTNDSRTHSMHGWFVVFLCVCIGFTYLFVCVKYMNTHHPRFIKMMTARWLAKNPLRLWYSECPSPTQE